MPRMAEPAESGDSFPVIDVTRLRSALLTAVYDHQRPMLDLALHDLVGDARRRAIPPERIVVALKRLWYTTPRPGLMGAQDWDTVYRYLLNRMLAMYFEEPGSR